MRYRKLDPKCCARKCQVPDCNVKLTSEDKPYCRQRQICKDHLMADAITCPKTQRQFRFCLQCAKLEPIARFEGAHRSCKRSLTKRRLRNNQLRMATSQGALQASNTLNRLEEAEDLPGGASPEAQTRDQGSVAASRRPTSGRHQRSSGLLLPAQDVIPALSKEGTDAQLDWHSAFPTIMNAPFSVSCNRSCEQQQQQKQSQMLPPGVRGPWQLAAPREHPSPPASTTSPTAIAAAIATAAVSDCVTSGEDTDPVELLLMQLMVEELTAMAREENLSTLPRPHPSCCAFTHHTSLSPTPSPASSTSSLEAARHVLPVTQGAPSTLLRHTRSQKLPCRSHFPTDAGRWLPSLGFSTHCVSRSISLPSSGVTPLQDVVLQGPLCAAAPAAINPLMLAPRTAAAIGTPCLVAPTTAAAAAEPGSTFQQLPSAPAAGPTAAYTLAGLHVGTSRDVTRQLAWLTCKRVLHM